MPTERQHSAPDTQEPPTRMPPRQRNEAFFAPASGEQALQKILVRARETGQCNLRGRQLTELPSACLDINSVALPEGGAWWDCRETLEKLDASQNELSALPELASLPKLRELLLNHNQLVWLPSLAVSPNPNPNPDPNSNPSPYL